MMNNVKIKALDHIEYKKDLVLNKKSMDLPISKNMTGARKSINLSEIG